MATKRTTRSAVQKATAALGLQIFDTPHLRLQIFQNLSLGDLASCARLRSKDCLEEVAKVLYETVPDVVKDLGEGLREEARAAHQTRLKMYRDCVRSISLVVAPPPHVWNITWPSLLRMAPQINANTFVTHPSLQRVDLLEQTSYKRPQCVIIKGEGGEGEADFLVLDNYTHSTPSSVVEEPDIELHVVLAAFPRTEMVYPLRLELNHCNNMDKAGPTEFPDKFKHVNELIAPSGASDVFDMLPGLPQLQRLEFTAGIEVEELSEFIKIFPKELTSLKIDISGEVSLWEWEHGDQAVDMPAEELPLGPYRVLQTIHEQDSTAGENLAVITGMLTHEIEGEWLAEGTVLEFGSEDCFPSLERIEFLVMRWSLFPDMPRVINFIVNNLDDSVAVRFDLNDGYQDLAEEESAVEHSRRIAAGNPGEQTPEEHGKQIKKFMDKHKADIARMQKWERWIERFQKELEEARHAVNAGDEQEEEGQIPGWALLERSA